MQAAKLDSMPSVPGCPQSKLNLLLWADLLTVAEACRQLQPISFCRMQTGRTIVGFDADAIVPGSHLAVGDPHELGAVNVNAIIVWDGKVIVHIHTLDSDCPAANDVQGPAVSSSSGISSNQAK